MKKPVFLGLLLLLAPGLAGCSQALPEETKSTQITISVLAGQSTSDAGVEDMIDDWLAVNYPEVKLDWECVDWGDGFTPKIEGRFAAGDVPDLMIGKAQDVRTYAGTGNLGVIQKQCSQKIREEALQAVTVDGEVYGMP